MYLHCMVKFDRHVVNTAAEVPIKFQSDGTIVNTKIAASRLCNKTSFRVWKEDSGPKNICLIDFILFTCDGVATSNEKYIFCNTRESPWYPPLQCYQIYENCLGMISFLQNCTDCPVSPPNDMNISISIYRWYTDTPSIYE